MSGDYLRLRQICLVAPHLAPAEKAITEVLGLAVCYRDPAVGKYGLENALWPVGDMFLEVVAPTQADTAAGRFLAKSKGRGGYMVIFDCSDTARRAAHARAIGVRVIADHTHGAYTGVQLHPRDCRAAMIEFNHTQGGDADPALYAPAGPGSGWQSARRTGHTRAIRTVELTSPDPAGLGGHWSNIIERPVVGDEMKFAEASLRFVAGDEESLAALEIAVSDAKATFARAAAANLPRTARGFIASGVEWIPVEG